MFEERRRLALRCPALPCLACYASSTPAPQTPPTRLLPTNPTTLPCPRSPTLCPLPCPRARDCAFVFAIDFPIVTISAGGCYRRRRRQQQPQQHNLRQQNLREHNKQKKTENINNAEQVLKRLLRVPADGDRASFGQFGCLEHFGLLDKTQIPFDIYVKVSCVVLGCVA